MVSCRQFLVLALVTSFLSSQSPSLVPTAAQDQGAQQEKSKTPKAEEKPDYSQEPMVLELIRTAYRFEKDGTGQHELTLRVKLQSEAALQQFGQLIFPYISGNENLDIDYVRVKKSDGTVIAAAPSDVQDLTAPISREAPIYTDLRQKHVTVPGLRPNDTLEYHAIWRMHTPLAANHFWLNHDFITKGLIVLDQQLEVDIDRASEVKLKTEQGFAPVVSENGGRRLYSWKKAVLKREVEDDEKDKDKPKNPDDDEPKPPQVQMTTFKTWDEVGQWYAGLERDRIAPDERVRAKVAELISGRQTEREKIEALYDFVAKNFRYVSLSLGQGRYQPHAAADVLANEYGDCKDKHTLLSAMLIAAGLRAYPALMNSSRKIDPDVPSPSQFDHVITAIPVAGGLLWADTTAEIAPFRLLSPPLRDKKALVIPATGAAHLETTPAEPPFTFTESVELKAEVSDLGKLSGHAHLILRGDSEMYFRVMFRRTPKPNWKDLDYILSSSIGMRGAKVTEIKADDPTLLAKPFEVEFDFADDDFLDWTSKKAKLPLPLPRLSLTTVDQDKQEGTKPIQLGAPINTRYRLTLTIPAKYQVALPLPLKVSRDYASYASSYKLEQNTLTAERTFELRQHELPAQRTQDYIAFSAATRADEGQTLSLETTIAGNPTLPDSTKVEDLIASAQKAGENQNFSAAESLLKLALEKEPKHKTARRQLGWVLFAQRKFAAAIDVLREQAKINPFDDYVYNLMGRAFWAQQKYEEAETSFRKQIEVSPLDKWVHGNLGQMLTEWRKFKEAVPELEQGIALNPEAEQLYISLGRAYLNLHEPDKATAAFEKAIKLAPNPSVWNGVAYYLSLSNVQLDKAQQYAESAIGQAALELRNVELSRLTLKDLFHVGSIAAFWDTLGWIYFQKGDLDAAERYISAAWAVNHHGEVGYHLGQILEKRGQKEAAIDLYALAEVSEPRVPESRESLERLVGKDKIEALLKKAKTELQAIRAIKVEPGEVNVKGTQTADFYVVLTPDSARKGFVTEVKFISGDEKLKPLAEAVKKADFKFVFPDNTSTKLIRRGALFCPSQCSFTMLNPEYITSLD